MKVSVIWKLFLIGALATCLQIPAALAATNSGDSTSAMPGDNGSAVKTPADADSDARKGTSNTKNMKMPKASHGKAPSGPSDNSYNPANPSDGSGMSDPAGSSNSSGYK